MYKLARGTKASYDAITSKDENTLYFITDAGSIYIGDKLIANNVDKSTTFQLLNSGLIPAGLSEDILYKSPKGNKTYTLTYSTNGNDEINDNLTVDGLGIIQKISSSHVAMGGTKLIILDSQQLRVYYFHQAIPITTESPYILDKEETFKFSLDDQMSDSSTNGVQNKVIKAYIDNLISNVSISVSGTPSASQNVVTAIEINAGDDRQIDVTYGQVPTLQELEEVATKANDAMPKAGGTFTGNINVLEPTQNTNPATKQYVDSAIGSITDFDIDSNDGAGYDSLAALKSAHPTGEKGVFYLVKTTKSETGNIFDEYFWTGTDYEMAGQFGSINTSEFATKAELNTKMDKLTGATAGHIITATAQGQSQDSGTALADVIDALSWHEI